MDDRASALLRELDEAWAAYRAILRDLPLKEKDRERNDAVQARYYAANKAVTDYLSS